MSQKQVKVKGYVIGNEKEHYAGEMVFDLPLAWDIMDAFSQGMWLSTRKHDVRKFLFKTEVEFLDDDDA